jgi:hypothetical protein
VPKEQKEHTLDFLSAEKLTSFRAPFIICKSCSTHMWCTGRTDEKIVGRNHLLLLEKAQEQSLPIKDIGGEFSACLDIRFTSSHVFYTALEYGFTPMLMIWVRCCVRLYWSGWRCFWIIRLVILLICQEVGDRIWGLLHRTYPDSERMNQTDIVR